METYSDTTENPFVAWDRMDTILARYWLYNRHKLKTLTGKKRSKWKENFKSETHFLIKRYCDLEFYQYLNKRLDYTKENHRKDGIVIRKHMKELARFILLDKVMERDKKFATIKDAQHKKSPWWKTNDSKNCSEDYRPSYAHLHRMVNQYYPELFTTRNELKKRLGRRKYDKYRQLENHKDRIVETQFTRRLNVPPGLFNAIVMDAMGKAFPLEARKRMVFQFNTFAKLRMIDPIDRAKLILFRQDVIKIIKNLWINPFIDADINEEFFKSSVFNYFVQVLFLQVRMLAELRWFKNKSKRVQKSIIFREPQLPKYSRKDAKKAVALCFEWYGNPEVVLYLMNYAAQVCGQYLHDILPKVGLWLNQECLLQLKLDEESKANVYYNIGIGYFETGYYKIMLKWLRDSISLYDRVGQHPGDQADAFGYIAEYWRSRNYKKYCAYRIKAEELVKSKILTKRRRAFHYLFLANCAVVWKDKVWEKKLYELGLLVTGNDPLLEDFALFFSQCLGDLEALGKRGPESGPGRCAPPRDWIEENASRFFKATIYDPDAGN